MITISDNSAGVVINGTVSVDPGGAGLADGERVLRRTLRITR
jgi:hypothetical protein